MNRFAVFSIIFSSVFYSAYAAIAVDNAPHSIVSDTFLEGSIAKKIKTIALSEDDFAVWQVAGFYNYGAFGSKSAARVASFYGLEIAKGYVFENLAFFMGAGYAMRELQDVDQNRASSGSMFFLFQNNYKMSEVFNFASKIRIYQNVSDNASRASMSFGLERSL